MFHRTARLFLRPPFAEDRATVIETVGAPMALDPALVRGAESAGIRPFARQFVITNPQMPDAPVVGVASLVERGGALDIRLQIGPAHRGKGFGAEALCGLMEIARALGFVRVTAAHCAGDVAVDRMLLGTGFQPVERLVENDDCCADAQVMVYQSVLPPHGTQTARPRAAA